MPDKHAERDRKDRPRGHDHFQIPAANQYGGKHILGCMSSSSIAEYPFPAYWSGRESELLHPK